MPLNEEMIEVLRLWREVGWIRLLDEHFARFLAGLDPQMDPIVLLGAAMTSNQLGRGHVCLDIDKWMDDPLGYLGLPPEEPARREPMDPATEDRRKEGEQALTDWVGTLDRQMVEAALDGSALVGTGTGETPLVLDLGRLYLRRTWTPEVAIASGIADMLGLFPEAPSAEEVGSALERIFGVAGPGAPNMDADPDWQQIACALAARNRMTIITGGPGTGKTWTVVRIIALLKLLHPGEDERPLRIRLAAPTGKAAQRLTESITTGWKDLADHQGLSDMTGPEPASTLHRLLGSQWHTRHFRHNHSNPLGADVVIIDEASMIDQELMYSLIDALAPDTRLILLGDKDQLASVEAGAVFGELCQGAERVGYSAELVEWLECAMGCRLESGGSGGLNDQRVMLRRNRRSTLAINELAAAVNAGGVDRAVSLLREHQGEELAWPRLGEKDPQADLKTVLLDGYLSYLRSINESMPASPNPSKEEVSRWAQDCLATYARFQVLTALKRGPWGVEGINRLVQEGLADRRINGRPAISGRGEWFHGRPVLVNRNDYATGLMNGDIGLCLSIPSDGEEVLRVVFPDGKAGLRYLSPSRLRDCQTAWAMTVHKSQGSEFTHTVMVLPDQSSQVLTRELIYTGLTRARERFTLVAANESVLRDAIEYRTLRSSALSDRLGIES